MNYLIFNQEFIINEWHGIKTNSRIPLELNSYLEIEVSDEEQPKEQSETLLPGNGPSDDKNTQTDLRQVQPIQRAYSLRGRNNITQGLFRSLNRHRTVEILHSCKT